MNTWSQREVVTVAAIGAVFGIVYLAWVQVWLLAQAAIGPLSLDIFFGLWCVASVVAAYVVRKPFAAFFAEEAVTWSRLQELGAENFLGAVVSSGDEVRRPLQRDLQVCHFAEVTLEAAARLARSSLHHVEQGGLGGQGKTPAPRPARHHLQIFC